MPIIIYDIEQNSPTWYSARLGNPGASSIDKIITTKGETSKSRLDYMMQLAGETITGRAEETFKSQAMLDGQERESASRTLFEIIYGVEVQKCGIVYKDEKKLFHSSPDGIVNGNIPLELKNPMLKTQVKYLLDGNLPVEYFCQTQMHLYVCESDICYFMSAYEGLPPLIVEVKRDDTFIGKLEKALLDFTDELDDMVSKLRKAAA